MGLELGVLRYIKSIKGNKTLRYVKDCKDREYQILKGLRNR